MRDYISREDAINAIAHDLDMIDHVPQWVSDRLVKTLRGVPSAQAEIKPIVYRDCANAMLVMWMDKVVTDGEYYRIMDKLNAYWRGM